MLFSRPMTHVFIAPHPDDVALSCGGLVSSLRELGQNVTIITVYSGGSPGEPTEFQRTALGFGSKAVWPLTRAFRSDNIAADLPVAVAASGEPGWRADTDRLAVTQDLANLQARQFWQRAAWTRSANITATESEARPLADSIQAQGSLGPVDFDAGDMAAIRRAEDERYAFFAEASVIWLDLPDAVYRGYAGDEQLLGPVRDDDPAPIDALRREILRLEPQMVYAPLAVGNHVDHQLCREAALALLDEGRRWVMPGPDLVGRVAFYEDFPYAWWHDFRGPNAWPAGALDLPSGMALEARYSDISEAMERKAAGMRLYASQMPRLFDSDQAMLDALASYHRKVAQAGGLEGYAERTWTAVTL